MCPGELELVGASLGRGAAGWFVPRSTSFFWRSFSPTSGAPTPKATARTPAAVQTMILRDVDASAGSGARSNSVGRPQWGHWEVRPMDWAGNSSGRRQWAQRPLRCLVGVMAGVDCRVSSHPAWVAFHSYTIKVHVVGPCPDSQNGEAGLERLQNIAPVHSASLSGGPSPANADSLVDADTNGQTRGVHIIRRAVCQRSVARPERVWREDPTG